MEVTSTHQGEEKGQEADSWRPQRQDLDCSLETGFCEGKEWLVRKEWKPNETAKGPKQLLKKPQG